MNPKGMMFDEWRERVGISRAAASRYRTTIINGQPMLSVSGNINGYLFVTPEEDAEFWRRARAGEFAKELKTPGKNDKTVTGLEDDPDHESRVSRARRRKARR